MIENICPVCYSTPDRLHEDLDRDRVDVACPRCGTFSVTRTAVTMMRAEISHTETGKPRLGGRDSRQRANASAWIRANQDREWHERPLTSEDLSGLSTLPTPGVLDRADILLQALEKETAGVGQLNNLEEARWWAASWCLGSVETENLARLMESMGWVEPLVRQDTNDLEFYVTISAGGWKRLEELRRSGAGGYQGFVAMSFARELRTTYDDALAPAIRAAGFRPHRVDRREFEGRIDDEIVAQIRRSRFVVADFTGHRSGVYWEAGFAAGLRLPVFLTCRKDQMVELHFDIRQYNCIDWTSTQELQERLAARIEAVIGRGPGPMTPASTPNSAGLPNPTADGH